MTMLSFRCGHAKTPENSAPAGTGWQCRECSEARYAAKRADTDARNERVRSAYIAGASITDLARQFDCSEKHIKAVLRGNYLPRHQTTQDSVLLPAIVDPTFVTRALKVAAEVAGANVPQLCSEWRAPKQLVHARWAFMTAMRKRGYSTPQIARRLNRDHSTILYGLKQAEHLAPHNSELRRMIDVVEAA